VRLAAPFKFSMTNEEKTEHWRERIEACLKAERFEEAISLYRQLVDLHPDDDSYRLGLAWACHDSGKTEEAVGCFEQIFEKELERRVFTGFAFDELVRIYKESKAFDRFVNVCERAAAAQPEDIALLGELGNAYLKAGRAGDAVHIFRKMTAMEPDDPVFFCSLGEALVMNGNFIEADVAYRQAATIDPAEAGSFYNRMAHACLRAGQPERAEKAFRQGLAERNDDPMLQSGLGDVLIQQGKPDEGSAVYERIIASDRASAEGYLNRLGHSLARFHYHREAVGAFKRAIALDARNPFYYLALAESYRLLGQTEAAANALRQAERIRGAS